MKLKTIVFALAVGMAVPYAAIADDSLHTATAANASLTSGEVKKVDKDASKVTIKHGPIQNLEMPAMTMVFRVKEPAMLDNLTAGDQIKFIAEKSGGALIVTRIEGAK